MPIHPSAHVDREAEIDPTAEIGPNAVIEGPVRIGARTRIYPNAYISGWTTIGADCQIHPGAVIGHLPQDFHYKGERSYCVIGDGTVIRELATVHRGTQPESSTVVGKGCTLLALAHVGHNCRLDESVTLLNGAQLSGHVSVGRKAVISGFSLIHQFVRIGEYVMIGGGSRVGMDAPPFMLLVGESQCRGINVVGLRRAGFSAEDRAAIKEAYRVLYRSGLPFREAVERLRATATREPIRRLVEFLSEPSQRGFCTGPFRGRRLAYRAAEPHTED